MSARVRLCPFGEHSPLDLMPVRELNAERMERFSRPDNSSLYFVRCGVDGPIKIGAARKVVRRLMTLQTANPETLYLLTHRRVPTDSVYSWEARIHQAFNRYRIAGEWFRPELNLLAFIIALDFQDDLPFAIADAEHAMRKGIAYVTGAADRA